MPRERAQEARLARARLGDDVDAHDRLAAAGHEVARDGERPAEHAPVELGAVAEAFEERQELGRDEDASRPRDAAGRAPRRTAPCAAARSRSAAGAIRSGRLRRPGRSPPSAGPRHPESRAPGVPPETATVRAGRVRAVLEQAAPRPSGPRARGGGRPPRAEAPRKETRRAWRGRAEGPGRPAERPAAAAPAAEPRRWGSSDVP